MNREAKLRKIMNCLDKWMSNREQNKWIAEYLRSVSVQKVSIYGLGILGKHLLYELEKNEFPVSWVMDKSAPKKEYAKIIRPEEVENQEDVDMVIITAVADVEEIEAFLLPKITGKMISIEELIQLVKVWGNQI